MNAPNPEKPLTKPPVANEAIKKASNHLRGSIAEALTDTSTASISNEAAQLTKFHGFYMQDDRDRRLPNKKAGKEKAFAFMLRLRLPGGRATAQQWRVLDQIAGELASPSLRLTTRQTVQFHGILKVDAKPVIQRIHQALLDSISACGDVNRNVMISPNPERDPVLQQIHEHARSWSEYALPNSRAYHEIWLDEQLAAGGEPESEPLYGTTYLPRKFKTGFALPPSNDVDIFTQDLGFIAIVEQGMLTGYNVVVGGGLGMSHGNPDTFPRLADILGFISADQVNAIGEAVLTTQRDHGDRTNRKHARLKYTIEDRGIEWFKGEVERRSAIRFQPARPFEFTTTEDQLGWHQCPDETWFYGLHVLSGRLVDKPGSRLKTMLAEIARIHTGDFRLTPSQNLSISGVSPEQKPEIDAILTRYGLTGGAPLSRLRLNALSCVALPTCGLALAESERILPDLIAKFETLLESVGLRDDAISLRVTGCPNGCARPYLAEIALVGRAPGKYAIYLGGGGNGTRLNQLFAPSVTLDDAVTQLAPHIRRYAAERSTHESFGDYCHRKVLREPKPDPKTKP